MAYDEELAERIRECLDPLGVGATEMKMFGGLAFLVGGNMAVAASGSDERGLMVRADPDQSESLCASGKAAPLVMKGRPMAGWLGVSTENVRTKRDLEKWVKVGVAYAQSLPPKASKKAAKKK